MIEPEIAFADLKDDMQLAEDMIKYIISYVLEHAPEEMAFFNQFVDKGLLDRLNHVLTSDFGHVTRLTIMGFSGVPMRRTPGRTTTSLSKMAQYNSAPAPMEQSFMITQFLT